MSPRTPSFIAPMAPTPVEQPPDGDTWLHEIKFDGYRTQLVIDASGVRAFARSGQDWSDRYRPVLKAAGSLPCASAIIDGEMCVQDQNGVTDYRALVRSIGQAPERLILFAFDLLHLNGQDLRDEPLIDRRARLQDLLGPPGSSPRVQFSPHIVGNGPNLFKAADGAGLEGIISKRVTSRYFSGHSYMWTKAKAFTVGEFDVIGVDRSSTGNPVALLSRPGGEDYAGDAAISLRDDQRQEFWAAIDRLGTPRARLASLMKRKSATWVRTGLTARVRHQRGADKLRHATLQALDYDGE